MSKICSSHNLSELEQLNYKLADSVLLLKLSFEFLMDNLDFSDEDNSIRSSIHLIYNSIDMLNLSVNNYFLFDDCLHSETDINF